MTDMPVNEDMADRLLDERVGELLRTELPVPQHTDGYRERMSAALTTEAVTRVSDLRRVPPARSRPRRRAVALSLAFLLLIAIAVGSVEALGHLGRPALVLHVTDDSPAAMGGGTGTTILHVAPGILASLFEAVREGDVTRTSRFYATNGWLLNQADGTALEGSHAIATYLQDALEVSGIEIRLNDGPTAYDRYLIQGVWYVRPDGSRSPGVMIFQFDTNAQIARQWIAGWVTGETE